MSLRTQKFNRFSPVFTSGILARAYIHRLCRSCLWAGALSVMVLMYKTAFAQEPISVWIDHIDTGVSITIEDSGTIAVNEGEGALADIEKNITQISQGNDHFSSFITAEMRQLNAVAETPMEETEAGDPPPSELSQKNESVVFGKTTMTFMNAVARSFFLAQSIEGNSIDLRTFDIPDASGAVVHNYSVKYVGYHFIEDKAAVIIFGIFKADEQGVKAYPDALIDAAFLWKDDQPHLVITNMSNPDAGWTGLERFRTFWSAMSVYLNRVNQMGFGYLNNSLTVNDKIQISRRSPLVKASCYIGAGMLAGVSAGATVGPFAGSIATSLSYPNVVSMSDPHFWALSTIAGAGVAGAQLGYEYYKTKDSHKVLLINFVDKCLNSGYFDRKLADNAKQPSPSELFNTFEPFKPGIRHRKCQIKHVREAAKFSNAPLKLNQVFTAKSHAKID